jgi:hypothetical protein
LLALALAAAAAPALAQGRDGKCKLDVAPIPDSGKPGRRAYSATEIADLELRAELGGDLAGDHILEFKVLAPGKNLYQSITAPFAADAETAVREKSVQGYPRPLKVQHARAASKRRDKLLVTGVLPVGGTSITTASLYGAWEVEAYLDGAERPCGSRKLEIVP